MKGFTLLDAIFIFLIGVVVVVILLASLGLVAIVADFSEIPSIEEEQNVTRAFIIPVDNESVFAKANLTLIPRRSLPIAQGIIFDADYVIFKGRNLTVGFGKPINNTTFSHYLNFSGVDFIEFKFGNESFRYVKESGG